MEKELKKLAVLQTGMVLAILYALLGVIIFIPLALIIAAINGVAEAIPLIVLIFLYPIVGFLGGILMAAVYNLVASWVGGFRFTVEDVQ